VTVRREWSEIKQPRIQKIHTRFFLSSLSVNEKSRSTEAAHKHWSIENRNHHKRDASALQDDRHRHRRPRATLN
jgi:predicted transposase YbfD/YdcC